jgi:serine/threonine-protein kinase haspin
LAFKLLHAKRLKSPGAPKKPAASTRYTERECYESLEEAEAALGKCIKDLRKRKAKKAVAEGMARSSLKSAGEVVKFGVEKGWIQ